MNEYCTYIPSVRMCAFGPTALIVYKRIEWTTNADTIIIIYTYAALYERAHYSAVKRYSRVLFAKYRCAAKTYYTTKKKTISMRPAATWRTRV